MKVAYVAGPYRDPRGEWWVSENIREAEYIALELWRMGLVALCPHKNTAFFGGALHPVKEDVWLRGDLELLGRCDLVVMTPRWEKSSGARAEKEHAEQLGIPVYLWPQDRDLLASLPVREPAG